MWTVDKLIADLIVIDANARVHAFIFAFFALEVTADFVAPITAIVITVASAVEVEP